MAETYKVHLFGQNLDDIKEYHYHIDKDIELVDDGWDSDIIVAHGGDGTLLHCERLYPSHPKFAVRDQGSGPTCDIHTYDNVFNQFEVSSPYNISKLEVDCSGHNMPACNDVVIRGSNPMTALRYNVYIDGTLYAQNVVGDGVCLSTIHGSTALYRAITHSTFRVGVGLAFINTTEVTNHVVLDSKSLIEVELLRGEAVVMVDNSPTTIRISEPGTRIKMQEGGRRTVWYGMESFMCPDCRMKRYDRQYNFNK